MLLLLGNGFIGKALSDFLELNNVGHRVLSRSIDNSPPDRIRADIRQLTEDHAVFQDVKTVVYFVHSSVPFTSMQDIYGDGEQNILSAISLFEIFSKRKIRVVYISSGGSVYGDQPGVVSEDTLPTPISAYGVSKYAIENYVKLFHRNFDLEYDILRLSNVYGIGQYNVKPQGVISALASAFLSGRRFKIWGDGKAKKDYLYIDDLVQALLKVISKPASNNTWNIASGQSHSLDEIVMVLKKVFDFEIELEKVAPFEYDVQNVFLDSSRFSKAYDWRPDTDIEMGIEKTVEWLRSQSKELNL